MFEFHSQRGADAKHQWNLTSGAAHFVKWLSLATVSTTYLDVCTADTAQKSPKRSQRDACACVCVQRRGVEQSAVAAKVVTANATETITMTVNSK